MFEYEDENLQGAIMLSKVNYVSKGTDKDYFVVGFAGNENNFLYVPLEQYTKFMNMFKAWSMKH
ncbi:hypothetical protein [Lentilactobacillus kefiri]|uniref:hypothetical protein n=1 Tax=Lentilactobacillus kefiri TaxID=33962 RepID=UPI000D6481BE|nr:hypothetical protein [Lentilactobacillus kefiri]